MMGGSAARARITPTRCCCPPDSSPGNRVRYSFGSRPTSSSNSSTLSEYCSFSQPLSLGTSVILSSMVIWGRDMSSPLIKIWPLDGSISRLIIFMVVVFPQPLGPIRATSSPSSIWKSISLRATKPSGYFFPTCLNVINNQRLFHYVVLLGLTCPKQAA
ncbi:Protein of uncharacterised function (DUF1602) [Mycobacteroides abscessus subsp. abscessus]|nr:Protein of uncharacterised function (DUF1602) [Mycobacteroides abscessus subsp. abscessus]